jgi:hypothetical protein
MNTHKIVNLIVSKFGGNRVKFDGFDANVIDFILGHNLYRVFFAEHRDKLHVMRLADDEFIHDNYSNWVEGILNGLVRNEAGEMVPR